MWRELGLALVGCGGREDEAVEEGDVLDRAAYAAVGQLKPFLDLLAILVHRE